MISTGSGETLREDVGSARPFVNYPCRVIKPWKAIPTSYFVDPAHSVAIDNPRALCRSVLVLYITRHCSQRSLASPAGREALAVQLPRANLSVELSIQPFSRVLRVG